MPFQKVMDLEMFPLFHAANFIHKSNLVRDDSTQSEFSRDHPFASWASTMVACFSQKMLANSLLAVPIIDPWQDSRLVVMATIIWYLINYSLLDIIHTLTKIRFVQMIVAIMVEWFRTNQIYEGVNLAMEKYDSAPFIALTIGTISGNGIGFMLLIHRLFRGIWIPEDVEFMTPSCDTRSSFIASVIFWYSHADMRPDIYLRVLVFLLVIKALTLWLFNPFRLVEKLIFSLTIGLWDTLSKILSRKKVVEVPSEEDLIPRRRTNIKPRSRSRSCRRRR